MVRFRRIGLLATIGAAVLAGVFFPPVISQTSIPAFAQSSLRPTGYADIVDKVKPAVISVRVKVDARDLMTDDGLSVADASLLDRLLRRFDQSDKSRSPIPRRNLFIRQGSGFFISADGYAVTNGHVVENVNAVQITTDGGKNYTARVVGNDLQTDIALIKVDDIDLPFVRFAESSPRVGDLVLAIGNPFGLGGTVTAGIVSARGRDLSEGSDYDFLQIDASVNTGNSGGPTFDMDGHVIGVNTAIVTPSGGSVGLAFAVPAEIVNGVVTQLREKGAISRGWIGVQVQPITPEIADSLGLKPSHGALVAEAQDNGPAAKAGIQTGDVITTVNGKEIGDSRELARLIAGMSPGASATVKVWRSGQDKTIELTLGKLPDKSNSKAATPQLPRQQRGAKVPPLGLSVAPRAGTTGIVIAGVDPDSIAAEQGLQPGDVIVEVAGKSLSSLADLRNAIKAAQKTKHSLLLRIKSGEAAKFVALPLNRG